MKKIPFPRLISVVRRSLNENMKQFGERFGVTPTAVSLWESDQREAPYKVLYFCLDIDVNVCDKCNGKGFI